MLLEEPLIRELEGITIACDDPYKESCSQDAHWVGVPKCCGTVYLVCDRDKQRMQEAVESLGERAGHMLCRRKIERIDWALITGGSHDN